MMCINLHRLTVADCKFVEYYFERNFPTRRTKFTGIIMQESITKMYEVWVNSRRYVFTNMSNRRLEFLCCYFR